MSAPFLVSSKKNAPKKIVIKPFKGVPQTEKVGGVFFFQPLILLTKSYPTTYWAKLCFVLLNAKPSNLPAFVPTIGSFFFLAFCKCKQQTERTGMWMSAPKRHETSPSYFFFKVPFQKKTFFTFQTWAVLVTSGRVEFAGKTDVFFSLGQKKKHGFPQP